VVRELHHGSAEVVMKYVLFSCALALVGCVDSTADIFVTRDAAGREVQIVVGDRSAQIRAADREVTLAWTDSAATLAAGGTSYAFVRAGTNGWELQPDDPAFAGDGPMLDAGERALLQIGVALPWRGAAAAVSGVCETWATWTFGGCERCYDAVNNIAPGYGDSWANTQNTCSSGALTSSCSKTWCRGGAEEMEMVLAN
jgi:hypothetical protein